MYYRVNVCREFYDVLTVVIYLFLGFGLFCCFCCFCAHKKKEENRKEMCIASAFSLATERCTPG